MLQLVFNVLGTRFIQRARDLLADDLAKPRCEPLRGRLHRDLGRTKFARDCRMPILRAGAKTGGDDSGPVGRRKPPILSGVLFAHETPVVGTPFDRERGPHAGRRSSLYGHAPPNSNVLTSPPAWASFVSFGTGSIFDDHCLKFARRRGNWAALRIALIVLVSLVSHFSIAHAQPSVEPAGTLVEVTRRLDPWITSEIQQKGLPALSIALVDDQKIVWARGFGFADPAGQVPATAETVYRVGSVSKLFTDLAVMQLVEQGKIDLDASVTRLLPEFARRIHTGCDHAAATDVPPIGPGARAAARALFRPSPARSIGVVESLVEHEPCLRARNPHEVLERGSDRRWCGHRKGRRRAVSPRRSNARCSGPRHVANELRARAGARRVSWLKE